MDPGPLRIGILDHHPQGGSVDAECSAATRNVGALLESLGHSVEPGWPKALEDSSSGATFGALWSAAMGVSRRRIEELLGRALRDDEMEPMNRVQADYAAHFSSVDYALALSAVAQLRRAIQSWWYEGWDLLLTPTLAELTLKLGTLVNDPEDPMAIMRRAGEFVPFTPPFNMSGQPAISLPIEWTADGLPVGVQLVAAYGREDLLIRIACQLEEAKPWAGRTPTPK
jgi:amidase